LLTALIWGLAFTAQRQSVDLMGGLTFGGVRFLLGAVSLIPVIAVFERGKTSPKERRDTLKYGVIVGVVLFIACTFQQYGIQITLSAGKSGFITGLYIVIVPILGLLFGRRTSPFTWIGAIVAVSGLYFISVTDGLGSVGLGDVLLLIGAFFWAIHILTVDRFAKCLRSLRFSVVQFVVCGTLSLAGAFIFETVRISDILNGIVPILYGGIASVGVAYTLQIIGQKHVEPSRAAIIFSLEALFSAVGAAIILGERMTTRGYVGAGLIFAGILLSQIVIKKRVQRLDVRR
jgi:drug/metabolite transporter (DMT)-like permease